MDTSRKQQFSPTLKLPPQMTSTIGREREIAVLAKLLHREGTRLVSLTGPGGVGKTRLSLEVARALRGDFPDGIYFVSLAPLREREEVLLALTNTLGITEGSEEILLERLCAYLHTRHTLLLLDNFEHILHVASLVPAILAAAPNVKILATSRESLHLYGEREIEVLPLPIGDAIPHQEGEASPALRLFVERAQAIKPDFALTDENYAAITEICQRLDGLPLAIELAAARVKLLSPQALLARLSSRLALLTGGSRDLPRRQQTLRNTLDWSYDLLTDEEQSAFRSLGCLIGTWSLTAAAACIGLVEEIDALDMLASLVDKSLVRPIASTQEEPRFMLLETLHEYATSRLHQSSEEEACQHRHAIYYLQLAQEADAHLHEAEQQAWLHRLDEEAPNLLLALRRMLESRDTEMALRLGDALSTYLVLRHMPNTQHNELEDILALDMEEGQTELISCRIRVLYSAGCMARLRGDMALARQRLEACRDIAAQIKETRTLALALGMLATINMQLGAYQEARSLVDEGLRVLASTNDRWCKAALHRIYGTIATQQGDFAAAQTHYSLSLMLLREGGEKRELADLYISLGTIMHLRGKLRTAHYLYQHAFTYFEELADRWGQVHCLSSMGAAHCEHGAYDEAREYLRQALALADQLGDREGRVNVLTNMGLVSLFQSEGGAERLTEAMDYLKESLRLANDLKQLPGKAQALLALGNVERFRGNVQSSHAYYQESLELAQRMNDDLTRARILCAQAALAHEPHEYARACEHLKEGILLAWRIGNHIAIATELEEVARVCLHTRQPELAVQLLGSAHALRDTLQTPLPPVRRATYQRLYTSLQAEISPETWNENWNVGRAFLLAQVVDLVSHITISPESITKLQSITLPIKNPFRLTARECDVLRLLALGYPDARIAHELVLSRRTVNTHLRSIYAKLGVSTRTAAARVAFEHQLA